MVASRVRLELLILDLQGTEQTFRGRIAGDAILFSMRDPDPRHATLSSIVRYHDLAARQSIGSVEQPCKPLKRARVMAELILVELLANRRVSDSAKKDCDGRGLGLGIEVDKRRLQEKAANVLADFLWTLCSVAEGLTTTHGMPHHEERYRARNQCLDEGGDIVKDLTSRARVSSLGGFRYRAAPSPAPRQYQILETIHARTSGRTCKLQCL
uniref:Uncharacterized protein n=1 Tax=Solanum lycopersicum TaxID=4081 RepID=A0A494G9C7_SOLLC